MSTSLGLAPNVRLRLSIMMFLQYAFNGIWIMPLNYYLSKVGFTGAQTGSVFGMVAIGCIIAPFFVGMIADRFFAGQKVLGVLNLAGAAILFMMSKMAVSATGQPQPVLFMWMMLAHCLCYMPTWALTNHIAMSHMDNPGKQFPSIRVMGTIGWIVVGVIGNKELRDKLGVNIDLEATNIPMQLGAGIGVLAGLLAFVLPDTPPAGAGKQASVGEILGTRALGLFKERNFTVFALCSFLILLPGMFYWAYCNQFLNEIGMQSVMFKQTFGQMAEMVFLFIMPFFFARFGVKWMMLAGMLSWIARFTCFSYGQLGATEGLLYLGLILHGACYDFFFVTGQLYTDYKAPREVRASAQGLITLLTFGLGWFVGSNLAGRVLDLYVTRKDAAGLVLMHNWHVIWLYPIAMATVITIIFLVFFKDNVRVGHDAVADGAAEAAERETVRV